MSRETKVTCDVCGIESTDPKAEFFKMELGLRFSLCGKEVNSSSIIDDDVCGECLGRTRSNFNKNEKAVDDFYNSMKGDGDSK